MRGRVLRFSLLLIYFLPFALAAQKPVADFTSDATSGCAPLVVNFTDISSNNPTGWRWDLGNGVIVTSNKVRTTFSIPGTYPVKLVVTNSSGVDSIVKESYIQVHALPDADFSSADTVGCAPITARFIDLSKPNSGTTTAWEWTFGDGGTSNAFNPTYTYTRTGTYDVSLKVTNSFGCSKTLSKPAYVSTKPVKVNILNAPGGGCLPYTFTPEFVDNRGDPITSYLWNFGDGSTSTLSKPSHTYTATGEYTLKLFYTTSSGCKDSVIFDKGIAVGKNFDVDFSLDPLITCGKQMVSFTSKTELPVKSYTWSFGDNTKATEANPTHRYTDTGYYTVSLTVDKDGCKTTATKNNIIYVGGTIARFDFKKDCVAKGRVNFKNTSVGGSEYRWDFGDNTTSTETNPEHVYTKDGDYQVSLVSIQNDGCKDTQVVVVPVWFGKIDVTAYQGTLCKGEGAVYNLVHPRIEVVDVVRWDFGGGVNAESNARIVKHLYPNAGEYGLEVISTDIYGCKDTITKTNFIRVNGPAADFDAEIFAACRNTEVTFKDLATGDGLNAIKKWEWNFGDGKRQEYTQPPFKHTYDTAGSFDVVLKVTDASGCSDSLTKRRFIFISEIKANFNSLDLFTCKGKEVNFNDLSSGSITKHLWNFGDGKTQTSSNPVHSYLDTGVYTIKLNVTSSSGCVDSLVKQQYVTVKNPKAAFGFSDPGLTCGSLSANFYDSSYYAKSWSWNFGDGKTSTLQNPSHTFIKPDTYTVKLTITSEGGCQSTSSNNITIHPAPKILNRDTTICKGENVQLLASGAGNYFWTPSTGLSCIDCDNPIASPASSQTYKLSSPSASRCMNEDSVTITVIQPLNVSVANPENSICVGETVQLQALGAENYLWSPSSTLSANNIANPKAKPSNDITYTVIGYDSLGCFRDTAIAAIKVYEHPTVDLGPDLVLTAGNSKTLTPLYTGRINSYLWTPSKDLSCYTCPAPVLSARDNVTYRLKVSNEGGCTAEDLLNVVVTCDNSTVFIPNTFSPNGDGRNDVFYPRGNGINAISSMRILNRWGEVVFNKKDLTPNNPSTGWDGMHKGKRADAGVYTYAVEILCKNSQLLKFVGNITLIQ